MAAAVLFSSASVFGVGWRFAVLGLLLGSEIITASLFLDTGAVTASGGIFARALAHNGSWVTRVGVAFAVFLAVFGRTSIRSASSLNSTRNEPLVHLHFLLAHIALVAVFAVLSVAVSRQGATTNGTVIAWAVTGAGAVFAGSLTFLRLSIWRCVIAELREVVWFTAALAGGAVVAAHCTRQLWIPLHSATYIVAAALLRTCVDDVKVEAHRLVLGTQSFAVRIAPECSGLEGMGLMLVFGTGWLWLHRREYAIGRAALILTCGIGLMWGLNVIRIVGLILLGHTGARSIALGGFHSQAGWIAFAGVSVAFVLLSHRLNGRPNDTTRGCEVNPTIPWLLPIVAILGTGMVTQAAAGTFEWLYPLRVLAACTVLWMYRSYYRGLNWRMSWLAPLTGAVVFGIWLCLDRVISGTAVSPAPPVGGWFGTAWLMCRIAGAAVTVPIAEELAFRGFLLRRIINVHFESVAPRRVTPTAVMASSVAFGLLHGDQWIGGTIAGIVYALMYVRQCSLGDAVAAHTTTNALLAAWVLWTGEWHLW